MDQNNNNNPVDNPNAAVTDQVIDGYSDVADDAGNLADAPDPGAHPKIQPMDPEERAEAEKEIREDERVNHPGDLSR